MKYNSDSHLGNEVGKVWIAQQQPAARRNAVRLVLKLVRPQFIEVVEAANTCSSSWQAYQCQHKRGFKVVFKPNCSLKHN